MKKIICIIILFIVFANVVIAQKKIASFSIDIPSVQNLLDIPASINLDSITNLPSASLSFSEIVSGKNIPVAFQVDEGKPRKLYWNIQPNQNLKRSYQLIQAKPTAFKNIEAVTNNGSLTFQSDNKNLLRYQFQTVYPPAGQDTNYKRSGFIHPLWTPNGQELTRIQAPDHYHHYGIWNPWTHTIFEKDTVDFWNIKGHQGTVRFAKFISQTNGPVYSEFAALHEHVVFKKDGSEKVALNEIQTVRVYKPEDKSNYFIVDITSSMSCASSSPFLILAYRYAGLGWRTTGFWNNENCEVLTSEGNTRKNTDGTKARWIIVQGALPGNDSGGAVILSYPENYNHPEPLRIWVLNTNGRGDMFANFAPTKDKDWLLEPGKTYILKYRLVVFNGKLDAPKAESAWQSFAESLTPVK